MNSENYWKELADDLGALLQNRIMPDHFREKYEPQFGSLNHSTQTVISHLDHFLSDYDIRSKDMQYKEMQESEMKKLISLIREDEPIEKILNIHFLEKT